MGFSRNLWVLMAASLGLGATALVLDGHEAPSSEREVQAAGDELLPGKAVRPFVLVSTESAATILRWDQEAVRAVSMDQRPSSIQEFPLRHDLHVDLHVKPFSVTGPETQFVLG